MENNQELDYGMKQNEIQNMKNDEFDKKAKNRNKDQQETLKQIWQ